MFKGYVLQIRGLQSPFALPYSSLALRIEGQMKHIPGVALLWFAASVATAWADFQISPILPDSAQLLQPRPGLVGLPAAVPARRTAAQPAIPVAHGFGQQVPLAFATRQIVPAGIKTTFGPGVDQAALVDWSGGRPWIEVLRAAVHPLGLHVTVRWMAISITSG